MSGGKPLKTVPPWSKLKGKGGIAMKKTAIVYFSSHHGNTRKLVEGIRAALGDITLIDVVREKPDLTEYDCVGFASGIYAFHFGKPLRDYMEAALPPDKEVFLLYTYGKLMGDYAKSARDIVLARGCTLLGEHGCLGYDTFGPLKLVGGIAKGHPDGADIGAAADFVAGCLGGKEQA